MSGPELSKHSLWPIYRRARVRVAADLGAAGKPNADQDIDACMAAKLREIAEQLLQLYTLDVSARTVRSGVQGLLDQESDKKKRSQNAQ